MENPIRCMAVDDEPLALELLTEYIEETPELELIKTSLDPSSVKHAVEELGVDLLFLDVQMPGMTGIEVVKQIQGSCDIILTTAFPQYALDGFELDVTDYLLKPIAFDRFTRAIQKIVERKKLETLAEGEAGTDAEPDHFFVKTDHKMQRIEFSDVLYVEGLKDYVSIYTYSGRVVTLQAMKRMEEFLPVKRFMRVHRSYIVAMDKIQQIEKNRIIIEGQEIPIGETYKEAFQKKFQSSL
ncbi:MAG TPA: LytTR family DNA-binding domain-containing protein [Sphingobacteriaceae bacterium]|nr:LytTR family DNA-binding domain-containing protein [Sphingobacteriaceae bacterium]